MGGPSFLKGSLTLVGTVSNVPAQNSDVCSSAELMSSISGYPRSITTVSDGNLWFTGDGTITKMNL
jgi:hypothetical protein